MSRTGAISERGERGDKGINSDDAAPVREPAGKRTPSFCASARWQIDHPLLILTQEQENIELLTPRWWRFAALLP